MNEHRTVEKEHLLGATALARLAGAIRDYHTGHREDFADPQLNGIVAGVIEGITNQICAVLINEPVEEALFRLGATPETFTLSKEKEAELDARLSA